jgi:hypothetical protein
MHYHIMAVPRCQQQRCLAIRRPYIWIDIASLEKSPHERFITILSGL